TYTDGTDIVEQTFANTNTNAGRVTSCTAPLLPTGLQIAAQDSPGNSCVLTGTPNTVTAQATYTITVTNDNGNSTLTLDITVNPAAPALQTPSAQSYATGAAVSLDLTNTGGGQLNGALDSPAGCVVDTPLPVGLSLAVSADDSTCTIAGTPESAQAANDYTITATNVTASSSATVSIAVVSGVATFAAQTPITYTAGTVVVEQTFANTNTDAGRVTSCTASLLPTGLQIAAQDSPGNGCVVTGTPAAATALANYSVTVSNENGDSTLTLAITVNPAAPVLQTPSAQSYATGAAVSLDLTNTGGGQLNGALDSPPGCIVNTPLPAGLSLTVSADGNTCTIAGTPETTQAASDYSIAATNATNSVSVTVNITVVSGIAAFATPVPYTYIVGVDTVEQTFANTNTNAGRVTNCTATSQFGIVLPAGLQIAALDSPGNGCILTGTPITATAQAAYTITVTNDNGDSTLPIDITINPDTPILPAMSTTFFITGAEGNFEMANTGGGLPNGAGISPSSCAVNTALPAGLNLTITSDDHTCRIFGTPETAQAARDYIVTATNVTGSSLSTVSITIVSGTAAFTDPGPLTYTDGTDILQQTFANTNTNARRVTNCAATPPSGIALPAGLQVAALGSPGNGCVLTGTPNTVTAQAAYTITVTNDNGTSTLTLDITVNPAAPALQTPSAQSYASGAAVSFDLSNTGGGQLNDALASPPGCVVDTPLPAGLSLTVAADDSTCTLAGTPETTQTASDYVITATNATASSSATVSITVVSGTAAFADPGLLIYTDGTDIVEQTFANTNTDAGRVTNCTATPPSGIALPAGLQITALDSPSNGCVLTGTPNTVTAQAAYTITVTNDNGTSTLTLDITVNPAAPALQTPSAQSYTSGAAVSFDLSNTGGGQLNDALDSPPGCVVNTPLPAGLSLAVSADDSTCTLAGTPETAQTANDYVITATNATASSSATVSISVVSGTAAFADPGSLIYTVGTNVLTQTFANTNTDAGRVTSCTATPLSGIALPAGLQIIALGSPGNGCVLTGTPSAITAQAAYTITVTNDNGTSTLTLYITVNPAAPVLTVPVAQTVATGDEVVLTLVNTG
ncbi:MAG: hypothetical protein K8963_04935, partial [Proteobacteria bacterium]|nr:hypothetical protein [Pseudomonadota bacterium]